LLKKNEIYQQLLKPAKEFSLEESRDKFLDQITKNFNKDLDEFYALFLRHLEKHNQKQAPSQKELLTKALEGLQKQKIKRGNFETIAYRIGNFLVQTFYFASDTISENDFKKKRQELMYIHCPDILYGTLRKHFSQNQEERYKKVEKLLANYRRKARKDPFFEAKSELGVKFLQILARHGFFIRIIPSQRLLPKFNEDYERKSAEKVTVYANFKHTLDLLFSFSSDKQ
jgi:hypothetical protein